ncbi:hypothetical protein LTR04_000181, partial [Oleoguttula sp. CCFEE 6159]
MPHPTMDNQENSLKPPPKRIWFLDDYPPFAGDGHRPVGVSGYHRSSSENAIVIDNGTSAVRAGWSFDKDPRLSLDPVMARYKDRKLNRMFQFVGADVYADGTARGQAKNIYEPGTNIVNNWDVQEGVLDYIFIKLGISGRNGAIDRPIVMTEPMANLAYSRRVMSEILFELYGVPSVAYGIDSLFSYNYNNGRTGLVVSSSYTSTHLVPVIESKPVLSKASRLNWGRSQSAEHLLALMKAKYPTFPGKLNEYQMEQLVREHCYVSQNYEQEMSKYLDWTGLEDRDVVIQRPFTEAVVVEKSEEELAKVAERKRQNGLRLQAQSAKMRLDKLIRKEQDLEYYRDLQQRVAVMTKKDAKAVLEADDFDTEAQLERKIKDYEASIRKARHKDVGDIEEEAEVPVTYPLLDIPDAQLDEEGLKQKRQQRLLKANHDARARAKAEKEREKARVAEMERLDNEKRENDLEGWLQERRIARQAAIQRIKDRDRLKADLGNRKSLASQIRMKNIANLASDNPTKKRRRGNDDDTFGADDADWGIYRSIATGDGSDDDEDEDLDAGLKAIEAQLLAHDPNFTEHSTRDAQQDWTKSLLHAFQHGPWPFDKESVRDAHQLHLNVERIRVPEVVFQPSLAGLDQAGLVEIASGILTQRLAHSPHQPHVLRDIFLTGGNTLFRGFEERLRDELVAVLPAGTPLGVRRAQNPVADAWRGAARWAAGEGAKRAFVSRAEWLEKGGDYIK